MVAICDVDDNTLNTAASNRFPKAKKFNDFRKMLDEMEKSIDAVTVSTPDHSHALAAAMALRMKKHCFTQKPLTHSIHEARVLARIGHARAAWPREMGNQGTANNGLRKAAALVKAGALGDVKEVHVWTNRPIWPQGENRPSRSDAAREPALGPVAGRAPVRPYGDNALPSRSNGAAGGISAPARWATWPATPSTCPSWRSTSATRFPCRRSRPGHNGDSYPKWSVISFDFPANEKRGPVKAFGTTAASGRQRKLFDGSRGHRPVRRAAGRHERQALRARRLRRAL